MTRLGVLVSGRGTNLEAVSEAITRGDLPAQIACVISNVAGVRALAVAALHHLPTQVISHRDFPSRDAFDQALLQALEKAQVDLVLLAGFMRVLTPGFVAAFRRRIVNVHPSLLPAFPGAHAVRDALAYGVKVSGCTVHLVDEGVDTGPILLQEAVAVEPGDDEKTLHARIQKLEHRLLPAAIRMLSGDGVRA